MKIRNIIFFALISVLSVILIWLLVAKKLDATWAILFFVMVMTIFLHETSKIY